MQTSINFIQSLQFNQEIFGQQFQVNREIPVLQKDDSQLPLVFQRLSVGSEVLLQQLVIDGIVVIGVFYQGFKLGCLPLDLSASILKEISQGRIYRAMVTRLTKKRFLPPSQVFVNILSANQKVYY